MKIKNFYITLLILLSILTILSVFVIPVRSLSIFFAEFCCIILLVLWILLIINTQKLDLLSPSPWLFIWFSIFALVIPLVNWIFDFTFYPGTYDYIPAAILLSVHGFSAFLIGYYSVPQKWPPISVSFGNFISRKNDILIVSSVIILLYFSVLVYSFSIKYGFEAVTSQVWRGLIIPLLSIVWALIFCLGQYGKIKVLRIPILPISLLVPLYLLLVSSGDVIYTKEGLFQLFVFPLIAGYILTGNSNWKRLLFWFSLLIILFILTFPIVDYTRTQFKLNKDVSFFDAIENMIDNFHSVRWEYLFSRLSVMEYVAGLIANEESGYPKRPDESWWILTGPFIGNIPNFLWPDKPSGPDYAYQVGVHLGVYTSKDYSNLAVTIVGHLLWTGGYLLVFFPMLLIGIFTGLCYHFFSLYVFRNAAYVVFYIGCLLTFFRVESVVNAYVSFPLRLIFLAWFISFFTNITKRPIAKRVNK